MQEPKRQPKRKDHSPGNGDAAGEKGFTAEPRSADAGVAAEGWRRALAACARAFAWPGAAWVVLAICLTATGLASIISLNQERERDRLRFKARVEALRRAMIARVQSYVQVLRGAGGLFAASRVVEHDEWRAYFDSLDLSDRYRGVQALGYVENVWHTNLQDWLPRVRQDTSRYTDLAGFHLWPAEKRESYLVVRFVEPLEWNLPALGYDIGSESRRRQAAEAARDTGKGAVTAKIDLVQAPDRPGALLLLPVYFPGSHPTNLTQRRAALQGWVYAAFVIDDLMAGVRDLGGDELAFEIYDGDQISPASFLCGEGMTPATTAIEPRPSFERVMTLNVANRPWTVRFRTRPAFDQDVSHSLPWLIAAGGMCISLLLFGAARSLVMTRQAAVTLAGQMTGKLRLQDRAMESSNSGIFIVDALRPEHPVIYVNPAFARMTGYGVTECLSRGLSFFLKSDSMKQTLPHLETTLLQGQGRQAELRAVRRDGQSFWMKFSLSPVRDDRGQVTHLLGLAEDITERKRAEEQLAAAERRYHDLVDNLPIGVYRNTPDEDGRFLEANPAIVAMFEADSKEAFLRQPVSVLYVDPARRRDVIARVLRDGFVKDEELELRTLKGRKFWASVTAILRQDEQGRVFLDGAIEDITERKQVADTLQRERIMMRTVLDNLPDVIYAKDTECRKTLANRADLRIMGCATEAEALGKTDFDFYSREAATGFFAADQSVIRQGRAVINQDECFTDVDGRRRWLLTSKLPLRDGSGRIVGLVGIGHDITARKEAEEALRESQERLALVIQGSNDGIWDWNVVTNEVYFSPRWKSMLGYAEHEIENHFAGWENLLHPEDRARALGQIHAYFDGRSPHYELEHRLRHKDGTYRWILSRGVALRDATGRPLRMAGSHVDLTERKQAEERLRQAYAELAQNDEALKRTLAELKASHEELKQTQMQLIQAAKLESIGTLAAGVAHEVKNPLQTMLMGLDFLAHSLPDAHENVRLALTDMRDAVKRANSIIRELLQFSAAAAFELSEEDFNAVVERSLVLLNSELVASRIEVVRHLQANLPRVRVDRGKMEQVLINLFINATQAMSHAGRLTVATRSGRLGEDLALNGSTAGKFQRGERLVLAEVRDTGPGIPEAHLGRIFDPFFTTKPVGVGTGLGLSVVKKIVDLHGGAIEINNAPEGGAQVTLVLRAQESETL